MSVLISILNFSLLKKFETIPNAEIVFDSCLAKFLHVQKMCLYLVKIIRHICFSSFGKGGNTKYLKVFFLKKVFCFWK